MKSKVKALNEAAEVKSTIERDGRWPAVLVFLDVQPGGNNALQKFLRDLRRAEVELWDAGGGIGLGKVARAATEASEEASRAVGRYRSAGIAPPADLVDAAIRAQDREAEATAVLLERRARID